MDPVDKLYARVAASKSADPAQSYTASLFARGKSRIAQKLGEEAVETVIAVMRDDPAGVISESADLLYHLAVVWAEAGVTPDQVWAELARREGIGGLAEKAERRGRPGPNHHHKAARMSYDPSNIFARILRGEIPCQKIYEDDYSLAFPDIRPQAPSHLLVIPKGAYVSFDDFSEQATPAEIVGFIRAVGLVAKQAGVAGDGYRLIANHGLHSHQEVPHFHVHILGGRPLGHLLGAAVP